MSTVSDKIGHPGLDLSVRINRRIDLSESLLHAPSGGAVQTIYHLVRAAPLQTNGSRGDAITSDAANATNHSSLQGIELRSTGSASHTEKGSIHQLYRAMRINPYVGGGDVYTEGFPDYIGIEVNRKGALAGPAEWNTTILAGAPARVSGLRIIMNEFNALADYSVANFGAGSEWLTTGARGLEIRAQGSGAQPLGTGIQIHGAAGFSRAICFNTGGVDVFKVGSTGFVDITRSSAGSTAMRMYNTAAGATEMLLVRADGKLLWGPGTGAADTSLERSSAAVLTATGTVRCTVGVGTQHVAAATPTGGASGDIRVGTGKIWVNDAGTWKSAAVA